MAENNKNITYTDFEKRIKHDIEQKGFFYFDKNRFFFIFYFA